MHLDPWQQWVLREGLAERSDGSWAAFECGLIVPRQNGKGSILEALELAALFLFDETLIVHSAHEFKTAAEHFRRVRSLIAGSSDLTGKVKRVLTANGQESIETKSGARLLFVARSRGSARGFTADRLVLDEAFNLPIDAMGAMLPALSTVPDPQVWYASSAPHSDSLVLHKVRKRGLQGDGDRLFFAEWGNDPGVEMDDWDALAAANPGLNIRISEQFIVDERAAIGELGDEYLRERMGVPAAEDAGATVFGAGKWSACADPEDGATGYPGSKIAGTPAIALDVSPDMDWSSFGTAGRRADGLAHIEMIHRRPGTGWVVERAKQLTEKWGVPLVLDPKSPAAGLISDLEAEKVPLVLLGAGDMTKACAALQNAVVNGTARHLAQGPLDAAVAGAAVRASGDMWTWARKTATADITPLVAVTVALWQAENGAGPSVYEQRGLVTL